MSTAWTYQKIAQVHKMGEDKAPWYVGWYEPDGTKKGKCCGDGPRGKRDAEKLKNKIQSELMTGTYNKKPQVQWDTLVKEYDEGVLAGLAVRTREESLAALAAFKRIVKPIRIFAVSTQEIVEFVAARRKERGKKPGTTVSPATINKDLRHLKAALRAAGEWGYLPSVPKFRMEKEGKKLPTFIPPEHFSLIYAKCDVAKRPGNLPYPAGEWWRGLLMTGLMTGWRISSILALKREDVDLDAGTALSLYADNKGKRDQLIALHPVVVEHLRRLPSFTPVFFPWDTNIRQLFTDFVTIQEAAGVKPDRGKENYGFHDLRRAFATLNAERLTPDALQALMQHKAYATTQKYINMAGQLKPAVQDLFVPNVERKSQERGQG